jgi:hypothetical protein
MNHALKTSAGAAALAFAIWLTPGVAQGPMYDRLHVELPYKITLGDKVLQPGDYTIQQLPSTGSSRVLLFYTDNGLKFETSAMTIPALDINTPSDTKVILNHVGDDYYINKIWVQGKDYGYELPIPNSLKERQKEATQTTVAGRYEPTSDTAAPTSNTNTNTAVTAPAATSETTSTATVATTTQPTTSTVSPATSPAAPTDRNANANNANSFNSQSAQNTTPTPAPTMAGSANRSADSTAADQAPASTPAPAPTRMPSTAANWLLMLLGGGTLSGAGMMFRRRQ